MNVQTRANLGIGYYYTKQDGRIVYIPIDRGKSVLERWMNNNDDIVEWKKVSLAE